MRLFHHLSSMIWAGNAYPCDLNDLRSYRWKSPRFRYFILRSKILPWIEIRDHMRPKMKVHPRNPSFPLQGPWSVLAARTAQFVPIPGEWRKYKNFMALKLYHCFGGASYYSSGHHYSLASSRWLLIAWWDITTGSNPSVLLEFDFSWIQEVYEIFSQMISYPGLFQLGTIPGQTCGLGFTCCKWISQGPPAESFSNIAS